MLRYIVKRILITIPVLLGVTFIIFTMMFFTPGDPAQLILGDFATQEEVNALRAEMGLDDPFFIQYFRYLSGIFRGDLGNSFTTSLPVLTEIQSRLPVTIKISIFCMIFAMAIGIPFGIFSAIRQYSFFDNIAMVLALLGISMPNFWLALILILFFSVSLGLLPASGLYGALYYIMPVISISAASVATITRMTRSSMLEVVRQDYIRTARAKGKSETSIIFKHALKNALIPIITVIGIQFASALSGAVVNEQIFAIPGLGKLMVDAIKARNYPIIRGGVLIIAFMFSFLNLFIDLLYAFVDPRIRSQYSRGKEKKKQASPDTKETGNG
jgi:peptide/nickel transport system permease protein